MPDKTENQPNEMRDALSRRDVLKEGLKSAAGLILLPLASAYADAPPEQWTSVGKTDDFLKDQPKKVTLADGSVLYVTRQTPDIWVAVSAKCTHHGCQVGWEAADTQFECPCHGAAFAATGKNLHGTRREPERLLPNLPTLPTRQKDGTVQVNLAAVALAQRKPGDD